MDPEDRRKRGPQDDSQVSSVPYKADSRKFPPPEKSCPSQDQYPQRRLSLECASEDALLAKLPGLGTHTEDIEFHGDKLAAPLQGDWARHWMLHRPARSLGIEVCGF